MIMLARWASRRTARPRIGKVAELVDIKRSILGDIVPASPCRVHKTTGMRREEPQTITDDIDDDEEEI